MTRPAPLSLMVLAAASWAAATVLTKVALDELTPLDLLGIELSSSGVAMVGLLAARGRPYLPERWHLFALFGVLEPGLAFGLFDFGLSRTGAADGAILIASQSLFAVVLARILLGERLSVRTRAAVAVGFAGSALVGLADTGHGTSVVGDLLVVAASLAAAANGVGFRRLSAEADTLAATATQLVAAALFAAPVILVGNTTRLAGADPAHLLAAVATGLLGGALPFLAFNRAIRNLTVAHAELILNLIPVLAAGGAVAVLGERLRWPEILGGVLVVAAATAAGLPFARREDALIRDARPDEALALESLQRRASDVWEEDRAQLAAHPDAIAPPHEAIADGRVRVAVDPSGALLGFSVVLPVEDGRCELDDLFVEPHSMRRGVGRMLVDDVAVRAAAAGATHVDVIANPNALGFYVRVGFEVTGCASTRFRAAPRMTLELRSACLDSRYSLRAGSVGWSVG